MEGKDGIYIFIHRVLRKMTIIREQMMRKNGITFIKIETYAGDGTDPYKNIAVIGIIDYLSVENYFRVIREKDLLPKSVKLILLNVELRISPIAKIGNIK